MEKITSGLVANIQKFTLHDGPGLRTMVFMKGCPLRCQWCCNPETQLADVELSFARKLCILCGECVRACPESAIAPERQFEPDRRRCIRCGACADICPTRAKKIIGERMSVDEVFKEVLKDAVFYGSGNGGLTISGGEPFMQSGFIFALLKRSQESGINTAVETCGHFATNDAERIVELLDRVYIDLKAIDPTTHKLLTGNGNRVILENIEFFAKRGKETVVRIVIIPGLNNHSEDIARAADFLSQFAHKLRLELLPYHKFGIAKYDQLGYRYTLHHIAPPEEEEMLRIREIFTSRSIICDISGK